MLLHMKVQIRMSTGFEVESAGFGEHFSIKMREIFVKTLNWVTWDSRVRPTAKLCNKAHQRIPQSPYRFDLDGDNFKAIRYLTFILMSLSLHHQLRHCRLSPTDNLIQLLAYMFFEVTSWKTYFFHLAKLPPQSPKPQWKIRFFLGVFPPFRYFHALLELHRISRCLISRQHLHSATYKIQQHHIPCISLAPLSLKYYSRIACSTIIKELSAQYRKRGKEINIPKMRNSGSYNTFEKASRAFGSESYELELSGRHRAIVFQPKNAFFFFRICIFQHKKI